MATLRETLSTPAATSQTEAAQRLITAKEQGGLAKAVGQEGAREENLGEVAARLENKAAADLLKQQKQMAQQQQAQVGVEQERVVQAQTAELQQQADMKQAALYHQTDAILDQAERSGRALDLDRDRGLLESAVAGLRLQNDKYITNLSQAAARDRITTLADAELAMTKEIIGFDIEQLAFGLDTKKLLAMDEAEFQQMLTNMKYADAVKLADSIARQNAEKAKYEGIATALGVGGQTAAKFVGK